MELTYFNNQHFKNLFSYYKLKDRSQEVSFYYNSMKKQVRIG
jgi:hypothetical protein